MQRNLVHQMPRRIFDLFIFSSLYIALCAVLMAYQVTDLLKIQSPSSNFLWFVFFSTICSYNFHWYFTPDSPSENRRVIWTHKHKRLHLVLIIIGLSRLSRISALARILAMDRFLNDAYVSVFGTKTALETGLHFEESCRWQNNFPVPGMDVCDNYITNYYFRGDMGAGSHFILYQSIFFHLFHLHHIRFSRPGTG